MSERREWLLCKDDTQNREAFHVFYATHTVQRLVTLTAVPKSLGLNPGEAMDGNKYRVPLQHGVTLYLSNRMSSRAVGGREVGGP
ncbi:hypothetical protein TNCV_3827891 [Trichonephila clavipes]|nr:hypothetical protein TNCV_3827891 [Trichonephila clavipes]